MRGFPPELAELYTNPIVPRRDGDGPYARFLRGEPLLHIDDMAADEVRASLASRPRALVELGGARTGLELPLRKDGALLGSMWFYRQEVRPFTAKQIELLQNFAAQAVIAMESARLITETREALEQQTATAEVLQVINSSSGDLAPVFDAIVEKALNLCNAEEGALRIFDGKMFHLGAVRGDPATEPQLRQLGPIPVVQGGFFERIVNGERVVHIVDVRETDTYRNLPAARQRLDVRRIRSWLGVALHKENTFFGAIIVQRREVRPFTDKQIALLQNFAAQAVIAMENARLLGELRQRNDEIAGWNRELEDRVAAQLGELERVGKLKRFLAPQLAELIVARGDEAILETHRRDIVVVFCDLRDFTAFAETAEPEEVLDLLREYHGALGPIVSASEGTLDHFSGDGIMVFFNDPVPVADASERAVRMATQMRAAMAGLQTQWRRQGRRIGFGAGIARGYATLGQIGFADRIDYTAIGTVCNLAARLCTEAKDGQILLSQRVAAAVEDAMPLEEIGELSLKGLREPVAVYNVPRQQS
jgi:adenylate cyclase